MLLLLLLLDYGLLERARASRRAAITLPAIAHFIL